MLTQPVCLVIQGRAQHMLPMALVSLPAFWFLPLKWIFEVSDALHKSLPMAKVWWSNHCCCFWEMHGFGYQALRKNSCMQQQCWHKLWTCCGGNERADMLGGFILWVEVTTYHTYMLSTDTAPLTCHMQGCCHATREQIMNREMQWYRDRDAVPDTDESGALGRNSGQLPVPVLDSFRRLLITAKDRLSQHGSALSAFQELLKGGFWLPLGSVGEWGVR